MKPLVLGLEELLPPLPEEPPVLPLFFCAASLSAASCFAIAANWLAISLLSASNCYNSACVCFSSSFNLAI